jgi:hypothetical protein
MSYDIYGENTRAVILVPSSLLESDIEGEDIVQ